jgi:hypothetical protein
VRRAPADIAGTYILDEKNWDRDFTSSSTFTVEEATGTIVLDMYDKDEETGEYPTFDYNVKITDFTYAGTVAYGFYDEETKEIFIPVQTTIAEMIGSNGTNYGRIVFSSMVLDQEGEALSYGYPMVLLINDDGTVEVEEGDFSEEAEENPEYEGAYIGGYCNFLPDYGEEGAIWNYGFEIELFIPNAMMQDNEVHIENGGWATGHTCHVLSMLRTSTPNMLSTTSSDSAPSAFPLRATKLVLLPPYVSWNTTMLTKMRILTIFRSGSGTKTLTTELFLA